MLQLNHKSNEIKLRIQTFQIENLMRYYNFDYFYQFLLYFGLLWSYLVSFCALIASALVSARYSGIGVNEHATKISIAKLLGHSKFSLSF